MAEPQDYNVRDESELRSPHQLSPQLQNVRDEHLFLTHMMKFFLIRNRQKLPLDQVELLMRSSKVSKEFTIDIIKAIVMLMTRTDAAAHAVGSEEYNEELRMLRGNFDGQRFLEFCIRYMTRAAHDFTEHTIFALSDVVMDITKTLSELKNENIISDSFLSELDALAITMLEEDRMIRGSNAASSNENAKDD